MVQFENAVGLEQRWQNLQRTSDFQAALLGMAGHDLRQPLQVIQSAYEWLAARSSPHPSALAWSGVSARSKN